MYQTDEQRYEKRREEGYLSDNIDSATRVATQNAPDKGLSIYYVILFWPLSGPFTIKLAASCLLETPIGIRIDK